MAETVKKTALVEGTGALGGYAFKLDFSAPYIVTAIHAGHRVRSELIPFMKISEKERLYEEDVATDRIIQGLSSTIWGLDSRTEYDLNRPPELALPLTPEMFWGLRVYRRTPSPEMNLRSLVKYEDFYSFVENCIKTILDRFGVCIIYDIHSYNIDRQIARGFAAPPVFNLGTDLIDRLKWKTHIDDWLEQLGMIKIPGVRTTVAENEVFSGRGEFCRRFSGYDPNVLVLPTEISKIYMDAREGNIFEAVIAALQKGLRSAVRKHVRSIAPLPQRCMR